MHQERVNDIDTLENLLLRLNLKEINIYKQAYLEMETPFIKSNQHHTKTKKEVGVEFKVTGQFSGKICCYLDLHQKELEKNDINFFKALFIESMNILAGQLLTQLKVLGNLNTSLSCPKFIDLESNGAELSRGENFNASYSLITPKDEYTCRVIVSKDGR